MKIIYIYNPGFFNIKKKKNRTLKAKKQIKEVSEDKLSFPQDRRLREKK